jgi:hypothetical protein
VEQSGAAVESATGCIFCSGSRLRGGVGLLGNITFVNLTIISHQARFTRVFDRLLNNLCSHLRKPQPITFNGQSKTVGNNLQPLAYAIVPGFAGQRHKCGTLLGSKVGHCKKLSRNSKWRVKRS